MINPSFVCHGRDVLHLGDGRWWDEDAGRWRDGPGRWVRRMRPPHSVIDRTRLTRVVLATCDHDPTNNEATNLAAMCQRCHLIKSRCPRALSRSTQKPFSSLWIPNPDPGPARH